MFSSVLMYVAGLLSISAAIYKYLRARETRPKAAVYSSLCLLSIGLGAAVLAPTTLTALSLVEPLPNLSRLMGSSLVMMGSWCMFGILAYSVQEPAQAERSLKSKAVVLVSSIFLMLIFLILGRTQFSTDFVSVYGSQPSIAGFIICYTGYVGWGLSSFIRLIRITKHDNRKELKVGMKVMVTGAVFGVTWSLWKAAVAASAAFLNYSWKIESIVSVSLGSLCVMFLALGALIPALGKGIIQFRSRNKLRKSLINLKLLWTPVSQVIPDITMGPGQENDLKSAVYRHMIEIRDGQLRLRPYIHPRVRSWVSELTSNASFSEKEREVLVEASAVASALVIFSKGPTFQDRIEVVEDPQELSGELESEIACLVDVSRAFVSHPVVAEVKRRTEAELSLSYSVGKGIDSLT